jgi:hypothetical protein
MQQLFKLLKVTPGSEQAKKKNHISTF